MGKYFGTDGVRGEANVELTPELAFKLGRFGGYVLSQHETGRPKVFVARDTRISGEMLESALVAVCSQWVLKSTNLEYLRHLVSHIWFVQKMQVPVL